MRTSTGERSDGGFGAQVNRRKANDHAIIENPLAHLTDQELQADVCAFATRHLPGVSPDKLLRGARVAKDIRMYYAIARQETNKNKPGHGVSNEAILNPHPPAPTAPAAPAPVLPVIPEVTDSVPGPGPDEPIRPGSSVRIGRPGAYPVGTSASASAGGLVPRDQRGSSVGGIQVQLSEVERTALRREIEHPYSERGTIWTVLTVSMAAFLQGFVQSSINGGSLYGDVFGVNTAANADGNDEWRLGAANASPYFFAAVLGCPLALPVNYYFGRRGGIALAAVLVVGSSLGAAWCRTWIALFAVRIACGLGMGLKAVSTPILASETAVGFWRGSSLLAWQLWVAFGIMVGFAFNLIFSRAPDAVTTFALIQGAPVVPALALLVAVWYCPESPRYLLRPPRPRPQEAYSILLKLRNTELQALRDIYAIYKSIEQEDYNDQDDGGNAVLGEPAISKARADMRRTTVLGFVLQWKDLFVARRLRNALISTCTVALAQQLCGINVMAFYSGTLFSRAGADTTRAMGYSLGYGAVNFVFALPAIRSIDVIGRRTWLLMTLPPMAVLMGAAAAAFQIETEHVRVGVVALFLFLFAIAYSPGLGPIPFTLASESFPLSHRESGTAFAISTNLLFAGLLTLFYPKIRSRNSLGDSGALGLFSGFNVLAFVLIFLLVEETAQRSLEDLDLVFAVPKRRFVWFQLRAVLPWFVRRFVLRRPDARGVEAPSLYRDRIWGEDGDDDNRDEREGEGRGKTNEGGGIEVEMVEGVNTNQDGVDGRASNRGAV